QQDTTTSVQQAKWITDDSVRNEYRQFIVKARELLPDLGLGQEDAAEFTTQVETIEVQLRSQKPRLELLKGAASAAKAILTRVGTSVATLELLRLMKAL